MKGIWKRLATAAALTAMAGLIGACAAGSADGRESSVTAYGTLDVGISHTTNR